MAAFIIALAALAGIAAILCFFLLWIKRLRVEAVNALREAVGGERVYHVEGCNFLGILSKGYAQVRGNGVLALTDRGIHFRMFLPRRHLFVPLPSVCGVSRQRSFLGKTRGRELLRVDFSGEWGSRDACAWQVPSLDWWEEALRSMRVGGEPPAAPRSRA